MQSGYTSAPVFGVSYDDKDKEFTLDDLFNDLMQSDLQDIDTFQSYGSIECESNGEMKTKETKPTSTSNSTDSDKMERRERNREHAKRSRIRKKFVQESLQKSVSLLQDENEKLKEAIRTHLGAEFLPFQSSGDSVNAPGGGAVDGNGDAINKQVAPDYSLVKALQTAQQNFVITDPKLDDNPVVYASHGFLALTGYSLDEVLGRNCRFMQGPQTDKRGVDILRAGILSGEDTSTVLLNYRADGTPFWNQVFIGALRDAEGNIVNYLGVQCKVSQLYAEGYLKKMSSDETYAMKSNKRKVSEAVDGKLEGDTDGVAVETSENTEV